MMDSGPVRNMQSTLPNKFEKLCLSLAFIKRIYHDARSTECQIRNVSIPIPAARSICTAGLSGRVNLTTMCVPNLATVCVLNLATVCVLNLATVYVLNLATVCFLSLATVCVLNSVHSG